MLLRQILGAVLVGPLVLIPIRPVLAFTPVDIGGVTVVPEGIITPADAVSLDVRLVSGNCCIELSQPTRVEVMGNEVFVDIFAMSGFLTIPDTRLESVPLGTFGPGTHFYEVMQNGPSIGQSQVSGSFHVIPEPSTVAMTVAALPLLLWGFHTRTGRTQGSMR